MPKIQTPKFVYVKWYFV